MLIDQLFQGVVGAHGEHLDPVADPPGLPAPGLHLVVPGHRVGISGGESDDEPAVQQVHLGSQAGPGDALVQHPHPLRDESDHAFQNETSEGLAYAYGIADTTWKLEEELAYLDRLRSVTREQIQAAARRYLSTNVYARIAFLPKGK